MGYQNTFEIMEDVEQGSLEVIAARRFFRENDSSKESLTDDQLISLLNAQRNVKWHKVVSQWWFNTESSNPKRTYSLRAQQNPKAFSAFEVYTPEVQQWKASLKKQTLYVQTILAKSNRHFDYTALREYLDQNLVLGFPNALDAILPTTTAYVYQQLQKHDPTYATLWMLASGLERGRSYSLSLSIDEAYDDYRRMEKSKSWYSDHDKKCYIFGKMLGMYLEGPKISNSNGVDPRKSEWIAHYQMYSSLPSEAVHQLLSHPEFKKIAWYKAFNLTKEHTVQSDHIPTSLREAPPFYTFLTAGMKADQLDAFVQTNATIGDLSYDQLIHLISNRQELSRINSDTLGSLLV